ncbi:serine-threonine protein kinase, plant-type, putative [Ricinus communis]|uniref:non-specific serine/threonine protein kinase n=1 Tax=Ricinus communis TaxID=3988 RepID=B9SLK8_RICCO|nr:serine-threonine protein kinase, plant-type, putative [Ricinus communis]
MLYFQQAANCLSLTENDTDRLALLEFKAKIVHDPHGIFDSWNDSVNFCEWRGVTCGHKHRRVSSLNLRGLSLLGSISPYIRNLTFLRFLNFANNRFHGEIPQEIGHLFRLRHLNLRNNSFGGEIPGNISYCSKLRIINFEANSLVGEIPDQLGSLKKLVTLFLGVNNLTGRIPLSIGNLSSLKKFSAPFNKLEGDVPNELGLLKSLRFFGIGANYLTGTIPATLYNISSIIAFSAPANQLNGSLPANIGNTLPNLQRFGIGANQFHGSIPISFTNASQLKRLDISGNIFTGGVPINLGNLQALQWLNLEFNLLGRNTSKDLSFIKSLSNCSNLVVLYFDANNFGGQLPSFIGNLSNLQELGIGSNHISGEIPEEIGNLINLYILGLEKNLFSSTIPVSLGKLYQLQLLYLDANILSGQIPPSLGSPELQLPACPEQNKKRNRSSSTVIILATTISSFLFFLTITSFYVFRRRIIRMNQPSSSLTMNKLPKRLHIATDVSSALYYLHEHCETPVIHCDLKPSNILLDDDMTARIGDFGLARLLSQSTNDSSQGQTSSFGIKGTIGYMAPEYGMGSEATAQGDVYSFGIILLEMFTGKRPTDEEFTDGLNLHEFVKAKFPGRVMEAVDPKLITREDAEAGENIDDDDGGGQTGIEEDIVKRENMTQEEGNVQNCIESVLEIGLACSAAVPTDRMSMKDVTRNLSDIMDTSLRFKTPQVDNHHQ